MSAHHSISSVYDTKQQVTLDAVVSEWRFVNPHPYVMATAPDNGGVPATWQLVLDNRHELAAVGVTVQTLRPGDRIVVTGSRSRTEPHNLYVRKLVRPADGFEYEQVGPSPRIRTR